MVIRKTQVLFICAGNIFRSMTAEYALRDALGEGAVQVCSAGLVEAPHDVVSFVADYLHGRGIDVSKHQPRRLTREILNDASVAIAMDFAHRDAVQQQFGVTLPLFSEVSNGTETPMPCCC